VWPADPGDHGGDGVRGPADGHTGGGERVLFIEDSPTLAQLLEVSLVQAGYQVQRAGSGEEGLELARANPPELLLCDVMLPGIDGFEVVRVLRCELATANISIIMLTAMANVMEGLDAGADDYVLKPSDHRELLARAGPAASCAGPRPCGRCPRSPACPATPGSRRS
jgi:DNA-binding response OmpR family regulator